MAFILPQVLQWAGVVDVHALNLRSSNTRANGNDFRSISFYFGPVLPSQPAPSDIYLKRENHPTALVRILSMLRREAGFPSFQGPMIISVLVYVSTLTASSYFPRYELATTISMDVLGMSCNHIVNLLMDHMSDYMAPFTLSLEDATKLSTRIRNVAISSSSSATGDLNALYVGDIASFDENQKVTSFFFYMESLVQVTQSGKTEIKQRTIYLYRAKFPLDSEAVIRDAQKLTLLEALSVEDYVNSHNIG